MARSGLEQTALCEVALQVSHGTIPQLATMSHICLQNALPGEFAITALASANAREGSREGRVSGCLARMGARAMGLACPLNHMLAVSQDMVFLPPGSSIARTGTTTSCMAAAAIRSTQVTTALCGCALSEMTR